MYFGWGLFVNTRDPVFDAENVVDQFHGHDVACDVDARVRTCHPSKIDLHSANMEQLEGADA